jgi:hypothetical protein
MRISSWTNLVFHRSYIAPLLVMTGDKFFSYGLTEFFTKKPESNNGIAAEFD